MTKTDLNKIITPVTEEDFFENYWERKPLYIHRNDLDYFKELISLEDIDRIISEYMDKPNFTLALINPEGIIHQTKNIEGADTSQFNIEKAYSKFNEGYTIRIFKVNNFVKQIGELAGEVEKKINCDININMYLTPKNSQGFEAHYDNHDVFILQTEGKKHWKVYEPPIDMPLEVKLKGRNKIFKKTLPFDKKELAVDISKLKENEMLLSPGDVLYIPRGFVHSARTSDSLSIHLTIGMVTVTWYEVVVNSILQLSARERKLREALPPGFANRKDQFEMIKNQSEEVINIVSKNLKREDLSKSVYDIANNFIFSRKEKCEGSLADIDRIGEINIGTALRIKDGVICKMVSKGDSIYLLYSGRYLELPQKVESMLRYILDSKEFKVSSINSNMNDESKLIFVRHLLKNGFLSVNNFS